MVQNQHEFYPSRWVNLNRRGWVNLNRRGWVSLNRPGWVSFTDVCTHWHLTNLFPECNGVHIFAHEWNPIEFDIDIPGINLVPFVVVKPQISKPEPENNFKPKQKRTRTSGIRDAGY
jgi:hypothetical protein